MGGQACVLYGAAEFSRDTDVAILAEPANLARLQLALADLQADVIAVPPFEQRFLDLGLAVHFRCQAPGCEGMRLDVMSRMRGVEEFSRLWERRTTIALDEETIELLSLPDLIAAKKTQRAKDWPMITRLVEANYFLRNDSPTSEQIQFWLLELRTPTLLIEVARQDPAQARALSARRSLLQHAISADATLLEKALNDEQDRERESDREHWKPLKAELERLRLAARSQRSQ